MKRLTSRGFTIVELAVVITLVAILAVITIASYTSVSQNAQKQGVSGEVLSVATQLKKYKSEKGTYPADLSGIKQSAAYTHGYSWLSSNAFCVSATQGQFSYYAMSTSLQPQAGTCAGIVASGSSCPTGFIAVPGSAIFGTAAFCAMKYEAKIQGNDNGATAYSASMLPESRASGTPWVNITQVQAADRAAATPSCTGCHLITEAEWMTLAANIVSVASNWSGGTVGSGYIYSGHNDGSPATSLAASTDNDGYNGTGNSASSGATQRRTLTLTNGEVIWDLAGNVSEWTSGSLTGEPGLVGESAWAWKEWNNASLLWANLPTSSQPSVVSSIVGTYSSAQGIGKLYSNYGDTSTARAIYRGGSWGDGANAGIFGLHLDAIATGSSVSRGFRVTR